MDEPVVFQITLPAAQADDLREALDSAVQEAGAVGGVQLEEADVESSASEMQFDPLTIAAGLYVGNLIVSSAAGAVIGVALEKLIAKLRADPAVASTGTIVVLMPDLSVIKLDPNDPEGVDAALRLIAKKPE